MPDIFIPKQLADDSGMVTIFSLVTLVILTIAGIAAVSISNNETNIVRNEQIAAVEFYDAENGINNARVNHRLWLTDSFLIAPETTANFTLDQNVSDSNGNRQINLRVRYIERSQTPVFEDVADKIPAMDHKGPPPTASRGKAYSLRDFESRRYSLTSSAMSDNIARSTVQAGVWKAFPKQNPSGS